jgi:two-component system, NarL family, invasion response regulator UvrY
MLTVLLVDDHAVVRVGLERIVQGAFAEVLVGHAEDGPSAVAAAAAQPWDVIVLDISLPTFSGLEALKQIRRLGIKSKVIMLSMHAGRPYVLGSFEAGAAGYLSKEDAPEELAAAIHKVVGGGNYLSRRLAQAMAPEPVPVESA